MPVSEPVTSPMTVARQGLIALLKDEFAVEGYQVSSDKLHRSLGRDGITRIGVSPIQEQPMSRERITMQYNILVQFYGGWPDQISPETQVDPGVIEVHAERFKRALKGHDPQTDTAWFYLLTDLTYPDDPTGNISRFEARVSAVGTNTSLLETTG